MKQYSTFYLARQRVDVPKMTKQDKGIREKLKKCKKTGAFFDDSGNVVWKKEIEGKMSLFLLFVALQEGVNLLAGLIAGEGVETDSVKTVVDIPFDVRIVLLQAAN